MRLCVSLGNTNILWGVFAGNSIARWGRLPVRDLSLLADKAGDGRITDIALASVTPSRTAQAVSLLAMAYQAPVRVAGDDLPFEIEILCDEPAKVGADRLLNAIGAYARARGACVVADVGTAVTVNAVNHRGAFMGGAIAPGASMMLKAMHARTELLPEVDFSIPASPIGANTADAMRAGTFWGTVGLLERLIREVSESLGGEPAVFLTGGGAEAILERLNINSEYVPTLTLEGLDECRRQNAERRSGK